jgi:hypothetical protein
MFRIFIPTAAHSANDVAEVLAIMYQSMAPPTATGVSDDLSRIEIDALGDVTHWQPSGVFPTLDSFKDYILASMKPVLSVPGVTVQCAYVNHPHPGPIALAGCTIAETDSCLLLKTGKQLITLSVSRRKPTTGQGVTVSGAFTSVPNTCTSALVFKVDEWMYNDKVKCPN